ncbi:hypothetical protein [Salinirubrum litoreum]|uniref:Right handed beta helix region n=1 Tax=Salinirubrum litoreum TaxID=1126234 RepID=A0ABD5RE01_9EURY|nr:hypothetical protein [Salinirubrum litoreum]
MPADSPLHLSDAQLDELASRVADVLDARDDLSVSRRQALGAGLLGSAGLLGGYGLGTRTGGGSSPATAASEESDADAGGDTSARIGTGLAFTPPGDVQAALLATYEEHRRGVVRLDPTATYSFADLQIPPYVTLDLNGAWVRPARDANVFEVAPAGHVCNGVVDVPGADIDYESAVVSCDNDYWRVGPGASVMAGPEEPMHDILYDTADKPLRWRCRGPVRGLFLNGPRDSDTTSVGVSLATSASGIAFQSVQEVYVYGFGTGLELRCDAPNSDDGYGFINGNAFERIFCDAQTDAGIALRGTDPDVNANHFLDVQIQPGRSVGSDGTDTCVFVGTGEGNRFLGTVWDPQKIAAHSLWFGAESAENAGAGDENVFVTSERDMGGLRRKVRDDVGLSRSGFVGHAEAVGL